MSNSKDLAARFLNAQRKETAEFQCHLCSQHFRSENTWWKHVNDTHQEILREFNDDENLVAAFRASKREECRMKNRGRTDQQSAESSHARQAPTGRGGRPAKGGITKGIETLRLEKQTSENVKAKEDQELEDQPPEEDVSMAEAPSSPVRTSGASRQVPQDGGGNRRSRTAKSQGGGRSGISAARRSKTQPIDPEFNRSLPDSGAPGQTRKLYDPSQPLSTFKPEESTKRLESASAATPGNFTQSATGTARVQTTTPARAKKENRRAPKARGASQPVPEPQGLNREAGKHFILRNLGHEQLQPQQNPQVVQQQEQPQQNQAQKEDGSISEDDPSLKMVKQPETRPISGDQLLSEVKGIYAGLVMVEAKCVEVDGKQAAQAKAMEVEGLKPPRLTNEQWQALIALHRTLLHEHHDFFLASQHPSASPALRRLAAKYAMPARMWRHGIHSFLELLRHRLPYSLEHMLTFIYLAYSIMALLYETVPAFEDTWIECLGDLGRYRMAIEDDDIRDREVWTNVARSWYSKAADKKPMVGRLYHHIAILARPNVLQQLFFYCKSLTVGQPFASARESILSLFEPVLSNKSTANRIHQPVDVSFVTLHGIWFTHVDLDRFEGVLSDYLGALDKHISKVGEKWNVQGCLVAVCNIAALYQYNSRTSRLRQALKEGTIAIKEDIEDAPVQGASEITGGEYDSLLPPMPREASAEHATPLLADRAQNVDQETQASVAATIKDETGDQSSLVPLEYAMKMGFSILDLVLLRVDDDNVLPHVHSWMVFLLHITKSIPAMRLIEQEFPFDNLVGLLNAIINAESGSSQVETIRFESDEFPRKQGRPLPEDWTLRGLEFTNDYFPQGWIENAKVDDEERLLELPSFLPVRRQRILWLGYMIAKGADWLKYDSKNEEFSVHPNLIERIRSSQEAALIKKEAEGIPKTELDFDIEMEHTSYVDEDEDFDDIEQSEETEERRQIRALKMKQRELKTQLKSDKPAEEQEVIFEATRRISAKDALRPNYTVIVVDTNFMLSSLDVFKMMIANGEWSVVIPNTVITEINGLNSSATVAPAARDAIAVIQAAINAKGRVRIITAKGSNITYMGTNFYKEKLEEYSEGADMSIDDVIISITQEQGKICAESMRANGIAPGTAQPAVLVTDDRNMRVKATAKHVPAISAAALKSILQPQGQKPHVTRPKRKSAASQTTQPPLIRLKAAFPKATEEEITKAWNDSGMNYDVAEMTLYHSTKAADLGKPMNSGKKRPKHEQGRTAG